MNSKLIIFIGQCGCQIGSHILEILSNEVQSNQLFHDGKLSGIFIDMERKVIQSFSELLKKYVKKENIKCKCASITGHWSVGYCFDALLEEVWSVLYYKYRRIKDFIIVHSLIGGAGGGFMCRLLEKLKTELNDISVVSFTVKPFESGESSFQYYNVLLTLKWLNNYCDLVFFFDNNQFLKKLSTKKNTQPSFYVINRCMALCIIKFINPISGSRTKILSSRNRPYSDTKYPEKTYMRNISRIKSADHIISSKHNFCDATKFSRYNYELLKQKQLHAKDIDLNQCTDDISLIIELQESSSFKFYDVDFIYQETTTGTLDISQKLRYLRNQSVCRLMLLICSRVVPIEYQEENIKRKLNLDPMCQLDILQDKTSASSVYTNDSVVVCSTSRNLRSWFLKVLKKSEIMYLNGAFLNWFKRFGTNKSTFDEAFSNLNQLIIDLEVLCNRKLP